MNERLEHELVDAGSGRRLDRFGAITVDRPAPGAALAQGDPAAWEAADYRFTRGGGWFAGPGLQSPPVSDPVTWTIGMGRLRVELKLSDSGQVGVFPEHAEVVPWLRRQVDVAERSFPAEGSRVRVLSLFAHTGLVTLALAAAGTEVTHVDASRPAVAQARRNADLSGLDEQPIRWIVDDVLGFVDREARRGRSYHGIVVDPPAYGHAGNRSWRLDAHLPQLLAAVGRVLEPTANFVLVTAHSTGIGPEDLGAMLRDADMRGSGGVETGRLGLTARSGVVLETGSYARSGVRRHGDAAVANRQDRR